MSKTSVPGRKRSSPSQTNKRSKHKRRKSLTKAQQDGKTQGKNAAQNTDPKVVHSSHVESKQRRNTRRRKQKTAQALRNAAKQTSVLSIVDREGPRKADVRSTPVAAPAPASHDIQSASFGRYKLSVQTIQQARLATSTTHTPHRDSSEKGRLHHHISPVSDLIITMMRQPSPQLEHIASYTSPKHITSAVTMLRLLQSRGSRLQNQIDTLETETKDIQAMIQRYNHFFGTLSEQSSPKKKLNTMDEMIELASGHWYEIFVLECSLRDVIDEESGTLENYVGEVKSEFQEIVQEYDAKVWEVMVKGYLKAVQKTVRDIFDEGNLIQETEEPTN